MLFWIPRNDPLRAGFWLGGWFFFTSLFNSLAGVAWNSWIQEWVPTRVRGKYFGRRNRWAQISALLFLLLVGWVLAAGNYDMRAFQAVVVFAMLLRITGIYFQYVSPTPRPAKSDNEKIPLLEQLKEIWASRPLVLFITFNAIWFFASNCFGPFYHVFLFKELQFNAFEVGIMSTASALGCAMSMPAWGLLTDRYGNKAVMAVSLILWQMQWAAWYFLGPDNRNLAYLLWLIAGAVSSGFLLGQFALVLKLIPVRAKNLAIGLNLAVTSLVAATAPVLGGAVLSWAMERWPGHSLSIYHICFMVNPILASVSLILLLRMEEPRASNFTVVVGALRSLRTLSGLFGLGFLADYVFSERKKKDT
jgi:Na+/melibiose symporter-like transporter